MELIAVDERGLRCDSGSFFIDPLKPVEEALITHAHAEDVRGNSRRHTVQEDSLAILRHSPARPWPSTTCKNGLDGKG